MRGLLLPLVLLAGCAANPPPACDDATRDEVVETALAKGLPVRAIDLPGCHWSEAERQAVWMARACTPEGGWHLGLAGVDLPAACDPTDRRLKEGFRLAVEYREIRRQLDTLQSDGDSGVGLESVRLIRERDLIRGIAQIKGWPLPERQSRDDQ